MIRLTLTGNTYEIKEQLKATGYRWNPSVKGWTRDFEDKEYAEKLAHSYEDLGVYGKLEIVKQKRYMVKESWIFNLESMHDRIFCLQQDMREGRIEIPFTVAGKTIHNEDDLDELEKESEMLEWKAKSNKGVTGKEYGRIKEIVSWRIMARYTTCMANGMDEKDAGMCFTDL